LEFHSEQNILEMICDTDHYDPMEVERFYFPKVISLSERTLPINPASIFDFSDWNGQQQKYRNIILDIQNILRYLKPTFVSTMELLVAIKTCLIPVIQYFLTDHKKTFHLIHNPFSIDGIDAVDFINTCLIHEFASQASQMTLISHKIYHTKQDHEADDRAGFFFQFKCEDDALFVSNDKFRSLGQHYEQEFKHETFTLTFPDLMQVERMSPQQEVWMIEQMIPNCKQSTSIKVEKGLTDEQLYFLQVSPGEFPQAGFRFDFNKQIELVQKC
jgi:hypothetical protein